MAEGLRIGNSEDGGGTEVVRDEDRWSQVDTEAREGLEVIR
jgi:hypothetical protein